MARRSCRALLLFIAVATAVLGTTHGERYAVGEPGGSWDLQTNYTNWASGINFRAGDTLVFKYSRSAHDVLEVSKGDYDSCTAANPISDFKSGLTIIELPAAARTHYFICGVPGHCTAGMKLAVRVDDASTAPNGGAPSPMTPRAAGPMLPPSSSSASAGSVASLVGLGLIGVVAGLVAF